MSRYRELHTGCGGQQPDGYVYRPADGSFKPYDDAEMSSWIYDTPGGGPDPEWCYHERRKLATVLARDKEIVEQAAELARLRVIEREHEEMKKVLRACAHTHGGYSRIQALQMAADLLSRLTPPAKAEGEGE